MPNRLVNESSPYLQQHAQNPVDWYPWGEEALQRAAEGNKPILVSIGYAACHWCHVMEKESFEDAATAAFMNEHFVNIKIDREERPDLDHIYMDAVQAISGSGGWPLNVFLTPDARPFYGGTYFPPRPAFNRPSWMDVLQSVHKAFTERREEMDAQAENLTEHIRRSGELGLRAAGDNPFTPVSTRQITEALLATGDGEWGGFGRAPKFPQTFSIVYLLRYYHQCTIENREPELAKRGLDQALLSLDKMIAGGIYDQVGGGFSRYSTDREWLAPHFEKMLYDNALLVIALSEAYQLTHHERYREVISETLDFVERELRDPDHAVFYSALDADSEGEEGKFYVWTLAEVSALLGEDAALFCRYYDISEKGNWEGRSILRARQTPEDFARENGLSVSELNSLLESGRRKLMERRSGRVRPLLDDKSILAWNALMNVACSRAYAATGLGRYLEAAEKNMRFLLEHFQDQSGLFLHTWKEGRARFPAFLDDLAFLIHALIGLQEVSGNNGWLEEARRVLEEVISSYSDETDLFFYFTREDQQDVILRKKEQYDGALPSGNAMMAANLFQLGLLLDEPDWRGRAEKMVAAISPAVLKYPGSFGFWAGILLQLTGGVQEIAITGPQAPEIHRLVLREYLPHALIQASLKADENYPLLRQKELPGKTAIWLCRNYTCAQPVFSVEALIALINKAAKG